MNPIKVLIVMYIGFAASQVSATENQELCKGPTAVGVNLNDTMEKGDVVLTFADDPNDIAASGNCNVFDIVNNSIVLKQDLKNVCNTVSCEYTCPNEEKEVRFVITESQFDRTQTYTFKFVNESYRAEVPELSNGTLLHIHPPIKVYIEECTDKDKNAGETGSFYLEDGDGMFEWVKGSSADSLKLTGVPDYERKNLYFVHIGFYKTGFHGNGSTNIEVSILDVDDQNPTFEYQTYYLNITEEDNSTINKPLNTSTPIHAFDQDVGINMTVFYSMLDGGEPGMFAITNVTGELAVTKVLDREEKSSYTLLIKATQTDNEFRSATATVLVTVKDIDDNIPKFKQKNYNVSINEHVSVGTIVTFVTATDDDTGINAEFSYKLWNSSLPITVNNRSGEISVFDSIGFDRESFVGGIMNFEIGTIPVNNNSPGDNATLLIKLIDVNDHNPVFNKTEYRFRAIQNGHLGQVYAKDDDEGPNANVTYHFLDSSISRENCDGDSNYFPFEMNELTGNITVNNQVLCERFSVLVEACDNPIQQSMRRCSAVFVRIDNNSTREEQNVSQIMTVLENSPINTTVDIAQCPGNTFLLQDEARNFAIQKETGLVLTNTTLDRESMDFHYLDVEVLINGGIICHVNITVKITDVNDNAPVFQDVQEYVFNLKDTGQEAIGSVLATDTDEGLNAKLIYYLQNERDSRRFKINDTTGEIFALQPKSLDIDVVRVIIEAKDQGTPSLQATESVYVLPKGQPPDLVPLKSSLSQHETTDKSEKFERDLQRVLGIPIQIERVDTVGVWSVIQIKSSNKTENRRELLAAVVDHYDEIMNLLYTSEAKPVIDDKSDEFGAAEIGLIVMAVVVLIGIILAIVVIRKQCSRAEKYQHLYESLTRNSSIYESQEIKVRMEDDTSQLNGYVNAGEISPTSDFIASATVNQAYEQDVADIQTEHEISTVTTERLKSLNSSETSVEEAMESLDQLSDRLEQEDGENITAVYAQVDVSKKESNNSESASINSIFVNENDQGNGDQELKLYQNLPNNLAMKVMQAKANSPLLTRKHEEHGTDDINDENILKDETGDKDEPDPDYDNKQVRFTTEVLVADGFKVEPPSVMNENETTTNEIIGDDSTKPKYAIERLNLEDINVENDQRGSGDLMLEEEISSPMDILNAENNDFFFGTVEKTVEETTHF